jgi:hypothetical protein
MDHISDNASRLFISLQIFENEIHYQSVRRNNDLFNPSVNTHDAFEKIYQILHDVSTGCYNTIHLYPDEYIRVGDMFNQTIKYFEDLEEYEKCHELKFSKNRIFFCIKFIV